MTPVLIFYALESRPTLSLLLDMAAFYTFEDLSGSNDPVNTDNPFQGLIDACGDDAVSSYRMINQQ